MQRTPGRHWLSLAVLLVSGCGDGGGQNSNLTNNDNTAQPVCGNGVIETGEQCDDGAANDDTLPGACRTSCRTAHCGDGVIDASEVCDGPALAGKTCLDEGFTGGALACGATCLLDDSGCTRCGDDVREGDEACDGSDLAQQNCTLLGAGQHGILRCGDGCHFDPSGCHTCGDGVVEPAEACEPGLLSPCAEAGYSGGSRQCSSTCDIIGACESLCGNGIMEPDEACDGLDVGDVTCVSLGFHAGDLRCSASCQLDTGGCTGCGDGVIDAGGTEECDGLDLGTATCASVLGSGYTGTPGCTTGCRLDLSTCVAPAVCGNGELEPVVGEQCDGDDLGGYTCATLWPGRWSDGALACRSNCTFDESGCAAVTPCGDGVREEARGEACDGADLGGATCAGLGFPGGDLACGADCRFDITDCDPPVGCGNGSLDYGELCDGANLGNQTCVSAGYHAGTLSCTRQCTLDLRSCTTCGNGVKDAGEVCDGTATGGVTCESLGFHAGTLGCSAGCDALVTTLCGGTCGDGTVNGPEVCDDGVNDGSYDGCEPGCGAPGPHCGDGVVNGDEVCDGLDLDGDACEAHNFSGGTLGCEPECGAVDPSACTCGPCEDADSDGYGTCCAAGPDCDDAAPGITGPCQADGCPQGWVLVEAGAFEMGCSVGDACWLAYANESPRHTVTLAPYCIERTEATVGAYRACKAGSHCAAGNPTPTGTDAQCNWSPTEVGLENHPINCIDWTESQAYCQEWLGGDLPTEAEWEKAARGIDQRIHPWGSTPLPDCAHANHDVNGTTAGYGCSGTTSGTGTWEVGHLATAAGDSAYGLKDMAGNVWEWVRDWYGADFYSSCAAGCSNPLNEIPDSGAKGVRGGSFFVAGAFDLRAMYRYYYLAPTYRLSDLGFRCRRPR